MSNTHFRALLFLLSLSLSPSVRASFLSLVSTWMSLWLLLSKANSGAGLRSACQTSRFPRWECRSMSSAILIVSDFFLLLCDKRIGFFFLKNRFIDQAPAARLYNPTLMYFLNGNPHLFKFTVWSLYLGLCVNEDVVISTGTFDPIFVVHRQTAEVNNIIELMSYTPLSAVHSHGHPEAWRLSASYTSYCMFDEYLEGRIW